MTDHGAGLESGFRVRPGLTRACVALGVALSTACAAGAPDLVLLNGRVFTANPERLWAEALAIRGDRVVAVGSSVEVSALARPRTVRRDLGGRAVVPGLNDAHVADPQSDGPAIARLAQVAAASGITSMQWFAERRLVADVAAALLQADTPQRIRLFRMPRPGPDGATLDSRPHLPPQPSSRLDVRGMGFRCGAVDQAAIRQAVQWAYSTEDLLSVEPTDDAALAYVLEAIEHTGLPEIWHRKRPRLEQPGPAATAQASRLAAAGIVAVARPGGNVPLASLVEAGVRLALATGRGARPFDAVAWAVSPERGAEALTMEQALMAFTRGSAGAELADRDKGHLSVGALADVAVLSADPFAARPEAVGQTTSVLTIVGGRVVHDVP